MAKEEHTIVLTFEVQKGELVDSAVYPVGLLHSMLVPFQYHFGVPDDGTSSVPLLLVDTDLKTHMYPKKQVHPRLSRTQCATWCDLVQRLGTQGIVPPPPPLVIPPLHGGDRHLAQKA